MKKWTALFLSAALLLTQFAWQGVPSFADTLSMEQKADVLNQVQILTGDGTSYNLGAKLKRSEASAFIVKALGVQNTVLQQKATYSQTSFKDVPKAEWYAPYVGYMTQKGIITGYPDGTFKPDEYISEKAFFSLVLKAMGYTSTDFDWNSINKVAYEAGLVEDIMYVFKEDDNTNYLRGNVVNTLYNALGKPMKNQEKKFIQLLVDSQMISPDKAELFGFVKFDKVATAVKTIKVLGSNQVAVTFNEDIVVPSADQILIYQKSDPTRKLKVKSLLWDVNVLTIETEYQTNREAYQLEISNITDSLGNKVALIRSDFTGYNAPELASPYFKISKIESVNQKTVNVYFTHPINDKADLELLYDFYVGDNKWIEGNYKTIAIKRNDNKKNMVTLSLKEGVFATGSVYTLKIKGDLRSAYGINLNKGDGEKADFTGVVGTPIPTTLKNAYSQEGAYVYVEFSQMVDKDSALKVANYTIKEVDTGKLVTATQVYGMKSLEMVDKGFVLKTPGLMNNKTYEITIKGVYDAYRTEQIAPMKMEFLGSSTAGENVKLESVIPMNKYTIVAIFNRELSQNSVNATVSVEGGPVVVMKEIDPENPKYLRIYLAASTPLQSGKAYTVRFYSGITDFMEKSISSSITGEVVSNGVAKDPVALESAYFVDESTIMVKYNQAVHQSAGGIVGKYDVYYSDGKSERMMIPSSAELVSDRVVLIKLPYLMTAGTYRLQVREMLDISGQFSTPAMSIEVK